MAVFISKPGKTTARHPLPAAPALPLKAGQKLSAANLMWMFSISHAALHNRIKGRYLPRADGRVGRAHYWFTETVAPYLEGADVVLRERLAAHARAMATLTDPAEIALAERKQKTLLYLLRYARNFRSGRARGLTIEPTPINQEHPMSVNITPVTGVPVDPEKTGGRDYRLSVTLRAPMRKAMQAHSEMTGTALTEIVRRAMEEYLERHDRRA